MAYKTLDELKVEFKKQYEANKKVFQADILEAIEHLDITDTELDELYDWFSKENIVISEDEDVEFSEVDVVDAGADDVDLVDDSLMDDDEDGDKVDLD